MTLYRFNTVDVFAEHQFGGNPLAVVHGADALTTEQMQAVAAEFNLSETTFVLRPQDPAHTARIRIFTPRAELPFAGHPNVGTAYVLASEAERRGKAYADDKLTFEELGGLVTINVLRNGAGIVGAHVAAPQPLKIGSGVAPGVVAALCGLPTHAIEQSRHLPLIASAGNPFVFTQLRDRAALRAAKPNEAAFEAQLPREMADGLFLYVREPSNDPPIQARMFAPLHGIPEDPATGSANVALIGLLAHLNSKPDLVLKARIGQGVDMGRPSLVEAMAAKRGGVVTATKVGGRCISVMSGTLTVR
ncbi:PhzF family phenazine biosynthesis protein [Methyloceanibacter sp. wino2]|uniref:PhzF family phenazine biosynthesis protein n=1 Tax=Methyloceanibacter sp. wino2 TaxID=2170729 RepID=UPI000D3E8B49|nr:PhzF family phenazine biosynthesis protein [Methyloceanibacter sp. wino2]